MTTYELYELNHQRRTPSLVHAIQRLTRLVVRHYRRRDTLQRLARLDADQLTDIGIDPEHVSDAINGNAGPLWNDIPGLR